MSNCPISKPISSLQVNGPLTRTCWSTDCANAATYKENVRRQQWRRSARGRVRRRRGVRRGLRAGLRRRPAVCPLRAASECLAPPRRGRCCSPSWLLWYEPKYSNNACKHGYNIIYVPTIREGVRSSYVDTTVPTQSQAHSGIPQTVRMILCLYLNSLFKSSLHELRQFPAWTDR